jgi:limonene-1,2-epoxide hydrolase
MITNDATEAEKANIAVVDAFCQSWNDPAHCVTMVAADASLKLFHNKPPVIGPDAMKAVMTEAMAGIKIDVQIDRVFAQGPVVVNARTDVMTFPDKPDRVVKVIGFYLLKDGKIQEWFDTIETEWTRPKQ